MGNKHNSELPGPISLQKAIEHRHLGHIEAQNHPKHGECFLKVYHFADQIMSYEKLRRFQARMKKYSNSDSVMTLKGLQLQDKQQMCAHNSDLFLYFEKYSQSLRTVIEGKLRARKNFLEIQIVEFLKLVSGALIFLQDNGFKNCQLDKDSILLCGDKMKILDMGITSSSPFQTFLDENKLLDGCYFSPELLTQLKDRNFDPFLSPKSDVFSLGMLTLEMACLEPLDSYYDIELFSIDYESLIHRVSRIMYSTELKTLIAGMLEYEADLRLGLISLQERVDKMLNVGKGSSEQGHLRRSRSSSTKMLKQLLTNSRKSNAPSDKNPISQTLKRKSSTASLTSMASLNSRQSFNQKAEIRKNQSSQNSLPMPSEDEKNILRKMVKKKTGSQNDEKMKEQKITMNVSVPQSIEGYGKEIFNKENSNSFVNSRSSYAENVKILHDIRRSTYTSKTFFDFPPSKATNQLNAKTPKAPQPYFKKEKKEEESIFRMIETDPRYNSSCSSQLHNEEASEKKFSHLKGIHENKEFEIKSNHATFSPMYIPKVQRVQQTNSITKTEIKECSAREVTEFNEEKTEFKEEKDESGAGEKKVESVSLRVKNSLDNMYKTTRSINSSEEKSYFKSAQKEQYKKIELSNGCFYEGEVSEHDIFEGNGILYAPDHQVIYNGSWLAGKYDGFGTLYNLTVRKTEVNKFDLGESSKCWMKYEGEFKDGERQGFGTIYYANGQRFSGCMKNGEVSGYGCFYDHQNHMTSGIWAFNKLQA